MDNKYCAYRHRRLDTNKIFYIGIGLTTRPFNKYNRNKYWHNIINKTNYNIEIIAENLDWDTACELEMLLISEYGRKDLGLGLLCNMTDGGDGITGFKHSEETKLKIKKFTKERMSNPEYLQKMINNNIGSKRSEETKLKMRNSQLGKRVSEETKNKLRIHNTGKNHNEETKLKVSLNNPRRKEIINVITGIIYNSITEAAKLENISLSSLIHYLKGTRKNITNLQYYESQDNNK